MPTIGKTVRILAKKYPFVGEIWTHSVCNSGYSLCFNEYNLTKMVQRITV